jgi:flagellar hook-associated protein 1 FlgK
MSGILGLMDIAKRALAAEQLGVEVTSHNISNVNTPGYSRQVVNFETSLALPSPFGPLGYGVQVTGIERAFDAFATASLDANTSLLAEQKSKKTYLEQVASLFNETDTGGLSELITGFWDAWSALSDNPSGSGERQALLTQAENLADAFSFRANQLVKTRTAITQQIDPTINKINSYAAQIAELNQKIMATEVNGQQANDLRDQRNAAINSLSELVGVHYYTSGDGTISVTLANGCSLVEGVNSWTLSSQVTSSDTISILWNGPGGTSVDVTSSLTGGNLSAMIEVRDTLITQYQADLDDLAKELIGQVNSLHSQGVGLELFSAVTSSYYVTDPTAALMNNPDLAFGDRITAGSFTIHVEDGSGGTTATAIPITATTTLNDLATYINTNVANVTATVVTSGSESRLEITAASGYTFGFSQDDSNTLMALGLNTFFTGDSAWTIGVNDTVANNLDFIAAGQIDPTSGAHAPGDNSNALLLAELGEDPAGPGGLTFSDAYQKLVTTIGLAADEAGDKQTYYQGLVDQFTQLRDSVSGVSLDEELTNLIKYQRAYQAAAKMITTADEMLQTLLSLKSGG